MVKSLIVALRKLKILQKCTKTDLQREEEKYVFVVSLGPNTCFGDLTGMVCRSEK